MDTFVRDVKIALLALVSLGVAIGWAVSSLFHHLLWDPSKAD